MNNNNDNSIESGEVQQGPAEVVFLCTHNSNGTTRDTRVFYLFMVNSRCWAVGGLKT